MFGVKQTDSSQVHEWCLIQTEQKPLCNDKSIERYGYGKQTEKQVKYRQWEIVGNKYRQQIYAYE